MAASASEAAREREFFKYYGHRVQHFQSFTPKTNAESSTDTVLTAFAQLACLRLRTRRAIIVLTNRRHRYILAEATRTISLRSDAIHEPGDALYWGQAALEREDLPDDRPGRQDDTAQNQYRTGSASESSQRHDAISSFYASVPIYSPRKINIGYLAVLDEQTRHKLDVVSRTFLEDLAATIMIHIEAERTREYHRRGERMVSGLGSFVEGGATIRHQSRYHAPAEASRPVYGREGHLDVRQQQDLRMQRVQEHAWNLEEGDVEEKRPSNRRLPDFSKLASIAVKAPAEFQADKPPETMDVIDQLVAPKVMQTFSRAANIIRESIEVEGVLFLDANITSFGGLHHKHINHPVDSKDNSDSHVTMSSSDDQTQVSHDKYNSGEKRLCTVLGFATSDVSSINNNSPQASHLSLEEDQLRALLRRYPRGKVLNFDERGSVSSTDSDEEELLRTIALRRLQVASEGNLPGPESQKKIGRRDADGKTILQILPGARSVALFGLFDSHRERWFACGLVWTNSPHRVLEVADVRYLVAFSSSIMSEVTRLDVQMRDQAKTQFISSISHELRSPLHGIMGASHFLQSSPVARNAFENTMIYSIETCGKTLLDTVDHLLDYAKINSFVKTSRPGVKGDAKSHGSPRGRRSQSQTTGVISLTSDIDLGQVLEEVVETVVAGHQRQMAASRKNASSQSDSTDVQISRDMYGDGRESTTNSSSTDRVTLVLDIEKSTDLVFTTQAGAWRRLIMNITGNALKYTSRGFVKVSLSTSPSLQKGARKSTVVLTVTDSGKGMSKAYVQERLFTAFSQEDSMSPGTGLGLSIVRTIVIALGGEIHVHSIQGTGTEITVSIPLHKGNDQKSASSSTQARRKNMGSRVRLIGFNADNESPKKGLTNSTDTLSTGLAAFQASLEHVLSTNLGLTILPQRSDLSPDAFVATETVFSSLRKANDLLDGDKTPWIVICKDPSAAYSLFQDDYANGRNRVVEYISQPCGPCKLTRVLTACFDRRAESEAGDISRSAPNQPKHASRTEMAISIATPHHRLTSSTISETSSAASDLRVLLVDDNSINLQLLKAFVRRSKHDHETATNGLEALNLFKASPVPFDVVLMDVSMPVMSGLESTRAIRQHERTCKVIEPAFIIALTAFASAAVQQEAFTSGVDLFLTKPVRFEDLRKILADVVARDDVRDSSVSSS